MGKTDEEQMRYAAAYERGAAYVDIGLLSGRLRMPADEEDHRFRIDLAEAFAREYLRNVLAFQHR